MNTKINELLENSQNRKFLKEASMEELQKEIWRLNKYQSKYLRQISKSNEIISIGIIVYASLTFLGIIGYFVLLT